MQIIDSKVIINLEANHKATPTTTGTDSNTNNQQPQRATRTANATQTNQHSNNTSTPGQIPNKCINLVLCPEN
jgi:hypothetical protein